MAYSPDRWTQIGAFTSPSFSKDGKRLFHMRGAGLPQPWVVELEGGAARQIAEFDEKVALLRRAPTDDRAILGVDAGGDERQQFHLVELDGSVRPLTQAPDVIHDFGAWSPDGTRIAYTANDRDESGFDVLVMELATGAVTQLRVGEGQVSVSAWSGETIAFIVDRSR